MKVQDLIAIVNDMANRIDPQATVKVREANNDNSVSEGGQELKSLVFVEGTLWLESAPSEETEK